MPDTTPSQPISLGKEPEIHVIPEQFYGVAGKAKLKPAKEVKVPEVKKPPTPSVASNATPGATAPSVQKITKPKTASKKWLLIPILALLFVGGLGLGTWFLLKPPAEPKEEEKSTTTIVLPVPTPEPEPEVVPESEPEPEPEAREPLPSDDEDEDGLTFAEEELFGTSDESDDSDKDGFTDLLEIVNLYNPSGFTPTKLIEANLVKKFTPLDRSYEILYPVTWDTFSVAEEKLDVFDSSNGTANLVSVQAEPNQERQTLLDWFINENPLVPTTRIEEFTTKAGDSFITTSGGVASYILGDGVVYKIDLATNLPGEELVHLATYRMMVNSFTLTP